MDFSRAAAPRVAAGAGVAAAALCLALAAASALVIAPVPGYDAWSWLLWGREVASGTLSTAEGPAFKPLPVAVTALLAPLGETAPWAWVILARAGAFAAAMLAFVVARREAGGLAGALAAAGVLLCAGAPLYAATGDVTGIFVALALGGVLAWRAERPGVALACAAGCCLLRVEAWPFALVAAAVVWRRHPALRPAVAAGALAIPAAWFVPEWVGSGDPLRSGGRARIPNPGQPALADVPALAALREAAALPLLPLLLAAAFTSARLLVAGGLAWVGLVAAMAQAGFSGEPRYALPGAALVTVGGAIGLIRLARGRRLVVALGVVLVAVAAVPRIAGLGGLRSDQAHQWRLAHDLRGAIAAAGGREAVLRCGTPYTGRYRGPLTAWTLRVEKRDVEPDRVPRPPGVVLRSRLTPDSTPEPGATGFSPRARVGSWSVSIRCASP